MNGNDKFGQGVAQAIIQTTIRTLGVVAIVMVVAATVVRVVPARLLGVEQKVAAPAMLTTDTPVRGIWREADGTVTGNHTTTLGELNNRGGDIRQLKKDVGDMKAIIVFLATDPTMRGHLLRHGFTKKRLDFLAAHFETTATP